MPTVWSVSTVGYAQMDGDPRNQSVNALSCRPRKKAIAGRLLPVRLLHVVFWTCDVVVEPGAVRTDGVEQRNAFRAVLHRVADQP